VRAFCAFGIWHPPNVAATVLCRQYLIVAWAPAHVLPGVLLAMALQLTIPNAEQRTILVFAGLIVATFIIFATRSFFKFR
jgi:hypothetical protein